MKKLVSICLVLSINILGAQEIWWNYFNDPALNNVIESTLKNNGDLAAIKQRYKSANARSDQSAAGLYPSLMASASVNYLPLTTGGKPAIAIDPNTGGVIEQMVPEKTQLFATGQAGLSARYSIDSWGAGYQTSKSTEYSASAAKKDAEFFAFKMTTAVSLSYFNYLYRQNIFAILEEQIASTKEILEMTRARYRSGVHSLLPVLQQEQVLASREAQLPSAKQGVLSTKLNVETISGIQLDASIKNQPLPGVAEWRMIGTDAVIEKRDDILAEKSRIEAAKHMNTAALLGHLPKLELTGMVGYDYTVEPNSTSDKAWAVGANLTVPLFTGFAASSGYRATHADLRAAEYGLKQKIISAKAGLAIQSFQVESQLEAYGAWKKNRDAAQKAFNEAKKQYTNGLTTYLEVLNALNALTQAELNVLNAHMMVLTAQVSFVELRGGWL